MQIKNRVLLVVNGDNDIGYLSRIYKKYSFIVSVDGAGNLLHQANIKPDMIVGDFDSIDPVVLKTFEQEGIRRIKLLPEKDFSDTHVALDTVIEEGARAIDIVGGFGSRWDHSLANLNLLYYGHQKGIDLRLIGEKNKTFIRGVGTYIFPCKEEEYFSFFAIFEDAIISLENMKYPLKEKKVRRGESIGLSNEYLGDAKVTIHAGSVLIVQSQKD